MSLPTRPTAGDTSWFVQDRLGLFIHWGLYALPARHEWVKHNEQIPEEKYERYFRHFEPDLYEPREWARLAKAAGMKYFVITTKHHEGFCLWDSKQTDYKAPNTPAGRDLLRPLVEAFRAEGLKVGFYHSLIDWHHPKYMIDPYIGPLRNAPDRAKLNESRHQADYAAYLHAQVRELLTEFGHIDILWFDFSYHTKDADGKGHDAWQSEKLYQMIRQLQPHIILNDRLDLENTWDIKTPEQTQPAEWVKVDGQPVVWEACQTFSGSWGYHRDEQTWKTPEMLLQMLVDSVSKGGNLLLNVGPTARGEFDYRAQDRLVAMGQWMRYHNRAIYGCTQAPERFSAPRDCRLTWNPVQKRLYLHFFAWPYVGHGGLALGENFAKEVEYAQFLNDASEVGTELSADGTTLKLKLPVVPPPVRIPVIELFLK